MNQLEAAAVGKQMMDAVKGFVAKSLRALDSRFEALELAVKEFPKVGPKGDNGADGKDFDPESLRSCAAEMLPPMVEVARKALGDQVLSAITAEIKALPVPANGADGKDGLSIQGEKGDTGERGRDGIDAKELDPEVIRLCIAQVLPAMLDRARDALEEQLLSAIKSEVAESVKEIPRAKDGTNGRDGKDAEPIHPDTVARMIAEAVEKAVGAIPRAKDGINGRDAADHHILPAVDESRSYPSGMWATHKGGLFVSRGTTQGMVGWDCVVNGISFIEAELTNEREISVKSVLSDGITTVKTFAVPVLIYRGIWQEAEYDRGDVVTTAGCSWHCEQKTTDRPGTSAAWKMMVKSGKDGKSFDAPTPATPIVRVK